MSSKVLVFAFLTPVLLALAVGSVMASPWLGVIALTSWPVAFLWVASLAVTKVRIDEHGVVITRVARVERVPWDRVSAVLLSAKPRQFVVLARDGGRTEVELPQILWWAPLRSARRAIREVEGDLRVRAHVHGFEVNGVAPQVLSAEASSGGIVRNWRVPRTTLLVGALVPPLVIGVFWGLGASA